MAKIQQIKELELQTLEKLQSPNEYEQFLRTAAHLHRYSFPEQVLIYAQRPDVTAVAPIDVWNKNFGRYVRKGSKGIAVVEGDRLRYVFDYGDTIPYQPQAHEIQVVWDFPKEHQIEIFKALEQTFGECYVDYNNHEKFILELVKKVVDDDKIVLPTMTMILERLGYHELCFLPTFESVEEVVEYCTKTAVFARIILDEVRKQSKNFGSVTLHPYNKNQEGDRNARIQTNRGLPNPELRNEPTTGENLRQVGTTTQTVPESEPRGQVQLASDERRVDTISQPAGQTGERIARSNNEPVTEKEPTTSARDNGLGETSEPTSPPSGRSSDDGTDKRSINTKTEATPFFSAMQLPTITEQLSFLDKSADDHLFSEYAIMEVIKIGSVTQEGKCRIYEQIDKQLSSGKEFQDFLKNEYYYVGTSHAYIGEDFHIGMSCQPSKGMTLNNGEHKKVLQWSEVAKRIIALCQNGTYMSENDMKEYKEYLAEKNEVKNEEPFHIKDDNLGVGGGKIKYQNNINAIKALKTLESEERNATPNEQEILSKYVGWGGLSRCFKENTPESTEIQELLTPEEYQSARASTTDSFYTSPIVIKAMYQVLENIGFNGGNILEPSCGVGSFLGCLPENLESSTNFYGVELDSLTGRIAKHLYPNANIQIKGFENTQFADGYFDVAIGNVPFGGFGVNDPRYNKYNFQIHDYFFAKTLDKVRDGGVVAFITSKGTLDKKNSKVREYIAQRAELLGAIRLPNTAFKDNAGTEVTSDIIFLQKRVSLLNLTENEPDWIRFSKTADGIPVNEYFANNPQMILGRMAFDERMNGKYGRDDYTTCKPIDGAILSDQLANAIPYIQGEIKDVEIREISDTPIDTLPADPMLRNFSYAVVDGELYYQTGSIMERRTLSDTATERIKGQVEIRDVVRSLIDLQMENCSDEQLSAKQTELDTVYNKFTRKWGLLNNRENKRLFADDNFAPLLSALEIIDDEGNLERKSDMLIKRTIKQHHNIEHVDTAVEALGVSLGEKARVDLPFMQTLCSLPMDKMIDDLHGVIYNVPQSGDLNEWQTADEYLSGNVREKFIIAKEFAKQDPKFTINVSALEKVIPEDIPASEIDVRLGAIWIPPEDYQDFIAYLLELSYSNKRNVEVEYNESLGQWDVSAAMYLKYDFRATTQFGTKRMNAYKIIENSLNLKDCRIYDYFEVDGKKKKELNKKETAIASEKQEVIKQQFKDWIWNDPDRRERLTRYYNDNFNNIRPREYDGSHLRFVGMNPEIELRKHQIDAVARTIYGGNTLLAHEVGAGKTYEMVASAMESKRLGQCSKSMIVVPNHLVDQWASEFLQLYPSANLLITRKQDFETGKRKEFCAKIATGDYDAVIIGHSQFGKIPISTERQMRQIDEQIEEITNAVRDLKESSGDNWAVKQMEAMKKRLDVKLEKLTDQSKKDDVITFEELGIDRLYIDESDEFKNLFMYTKMRNVAGIAQTDAQKSSDLYMKCRYMDEITYNKGIVFATGTPIANSMCELYTVQRYLQYDELRKRGLLHFDSWASTFGETVTAIELAPERTGYRTKTRFAKFYNLPELMSMFKECADIKTADVLNLPTPKATFHNVSVPADEFQKEIVQSLSERADQVRNRLVEPNIDNMLKITNDGRKLALDKRIINPLLPDHDGSKVNACIQNSFEIWEQSKDKRSTQLIFCDLSTPNADGFNVYQDIKDKLLLKGVSEDEIAFIHDANTDQRKKELFAKVRAGTVRIMLGSTAKMGAGTNVQNKIIASHDLDCPWRPRDLQQRAGRIVRQGNTNEEVHIFRYVTENTFDSYLYQIIENKQRFISQIMTSKSPVRRVDDLDEATLNYAEIKALATGDPHIKEKMELDVEVSKLKMLKSGWQSQKFNLEDFIYKEYPQRLSLYKERIAGMKVDISNYKATDEFTGMTIKGQFYSEKHMAGDALLKSITGLHDGKPTEVGEYVGFKIIVEFSSFHKKFTATLQGETYHKCELGADNIGNITRFDNLLKKMFEELSELEQKLVDLDSRYEQSNKMVLVPFDRDEELKQKEGRLNELNALLSADDTVIMDDEPANVAEASYEEVER